MNLRNALLACSVALVLVPIVAAATQSASSDTAVLRNTIVNLLDAMVKQGLISRDAAEKLVADAQTKADAESQANATPINPGDVRVTYVPQVVQDQITAQVKQDVQASVVATFSCPAKISVTSWSRSSRSVATVPSGRGPMR